METARMNPGMESHRKRSSSELTNPTALRKGGEGSIDKSDRRAQSPQNERRIEGESPEGGS